MSLKGAAMSELTISDFKSKYKPIGFSMELKSQGQSAYETGKIGGHTPLYTDEQIQDYLSNQPRLTIPKSIADTLDIAIKGLTEFEDYLWAVDEFDVLVPYDRAEYFRKWSNEEMNAHALAVSYVTGKALGVDLVKVRADEN
jgi:hypothetical protein